MTLETILIFIPVSLMAIAMPGQDFVFILGSSLSKNKWNGVFASFGIGLGNFAWVILAAFGISALFEQSPLALTLFKYAGALYLVYIGTMGYQSDTTVEFKERHEPSLFSFFKRGFITNILNPKCALFLLAFLPRFIDTQLGNESFQIFILGIINTVLAILFFTLLALTVYKVKHFVEHNQRFLELQSKITSLIFIGLGLLIPLFDLLSYLEMI